jgi:hypothetical protein
MTRFPASIVPALAKHACGKCEREFAPLGIVFSRNRLHSLRLGHSAAQKTRIDLQALKDDAA